MDNRIFNVNGESLDMLKRTLELAFEQAGFSGSLAYEITDKGLILMWYKTNKAKLFSSPLPPNEAALFVWGWLRSEGAKHIKPSEWDANLEPDTSCSPGWRVFCEDWGYVGDNRFAIVAITPAFMWYGK